MKKWLAEDWEFEITVIKGKQRHAGWALKRETGSFANTNARRDFARRPCRYCIRCAKLCGVGEITGCAAAS